jgi:hypothetical protein
MSRALPDQLREGPHLTGYTIYHNDKFHHLQINGRLVRLSPSEYRLCIRLLRHFECLQQRVHPMQEALNIYVSFEELQRCADLAERGHVIKHVSNANGKLRVHGITMLCVGECGYTLNFQRSSALFTD